MYAFMLNQQKMDQFVELLTDAIRLANNDCDWTLAAQFESMRDELTSIDPIATTR
jgi:hypothetical protein